MTSGKTLRVLAMSGSLRKASYNTAALHAAQALAPSGGHDQRDRHSISIRRLPPPCGRYA